MKAETAVHTETPKQAAEAISASLSYLQREANAYGLSEVSELVGRAREKAEEVA